MKINRSLLGYSFVFIAIFAFIFLMRGTVTDQQVTAKMGDMNNMFGILFTALGVIATLSTGVFAGTVLFFMPKLESKKKDIIFRLIGAGAVILFTVFELIETVKYVRFPIMQKDAGANKALIITLVLIINLVIIMFTRFGFKKRFDLTNLIPTCIVIILIIIIYATCTEFSKYFVSRPRPRVVDEGVIAFRNWYEWRPFLAFKSQYHDCKSFVSGHTSNAACMISLLPLAMSLYKKKPSNAVQLVAIICGALYTFVVAFSRIIAKAHYLTDVMAGIILSIIVQAIIIAVADRIVKKHA